MKYSAKAKVFRGIYVENEKVFFDLTNSATYRIKKTLDKWLRYAKGMLGKMFLAKAFTALKFR